MASEENLPDALQVIAEVARAFDALGVDYLVGGSVASSTLGNFRATQDVDIFAALQSRQAAPLATQLGDDYYADVDTMRRAIVTHGSFNIIQIPLGVKVDIFVSDESAYAREEMRRRLRLSLFGTGAEPVCVATAEDIILQKLRWYRLTGEKSERQWGDVQGVLRVQAGQLDIEYMRHWATQIAVAELLDRALTDAGMT